MTDSNWQIGKEGDAGGWFFSKLMEKYPLPGIDLAAVIEGQQKDIEALGEANRLAGEGIKALIARRDAMLQQAFADWQAAIQNNAGAEVLAEVARHGLEKAVSNFRELVEMEAQARSNAWKVVQDRVQENLANLQKLLQPK